MQQQIEQEEAQKRGYTQDEWSEVLRRAERVRGEREDSLSDRTLVESAAEVGISEADIREAQRQLEIEKQAEVHAQEAAKQRKKVVLGTVLGLSLLTSGIGLTSYNGLNAEYQNQARLRADLQATLQRRAEVVSSAQSMVDQAAVDRAALRQRLDEALKGLKSGDLSQQLRANQQLKLTTDELAGKSRDPELVRDLNAQLEGSANRVNVAQQRHNAAVAKYNEKARSFPTSVFRPLFGLPGSVPSFDVSVAPVAGS